MIVLVLNILELLSRDQFLQYLVYHLQSVLVFILYEFEGLVLLMEIELWNHPYIEHVTKYIILNLSVGCLWKLLSQL